MARQYLIIPTAEVSKVNFSLVLETSESTLRKSVDETKTFVKWEGSTAPDFVADTTSVGGSSSSSYITRPLTLENPSTAIEIRLSSNVRSSSSVRVFFRATSSEEVRNINDLDFTAFNVDGREDVLVPAAENDEDFKEYKYSVTGLSSFTAFQIKIVMKGTNSAYPPRIKDLRGLALAV